MSSASTDPQPLRVFVAGATGVIGRRVLAQLVAAGHVAGGMTRSQAGAGVVAEAGGEPIRCDVFDPEGLAAAVAAFAPDAIVNELTDLPDEVGEIAAHGERNARIRTEGTANLIAAARASGSPKLLAQSVAWPLPPGPDADSIASLEAAVLGEGGVVLRYGQFYGPGTYNEGGQPADPRVSLDTAAARTVEALGAPSGVIIVVD
jgi:uncharacterized protein YbjT (DUF2867 family)